MAQKRKEEVEARRRQEQANRAKAEYIKKMLVEKERERLQLGEEIERVKYAVSRSGSFDDVM